MEDAALSAFAVLFTQRPSFLDYQGRMQRQLGRHNAHSLFGVHQLPSDNPIRNLLDPVPPATVFPRFAAISQGRYRHGYLHSFRSRFNPVLVAFDGTEYVSSQKLGCDPCSHRTLNNGAILNYPVVLTPVVVAPGQETVVPLAPEFVRPQDGHDKQDGELAAARRWLEHCGGRYAPWGITLRGDDLYGHQPFCQEVRRHGCHFRFVCRPASHPTLYAWVADVARLGQVRTVVKTRWTGTQRLIDTYRYVHQVPLRDSDEALVVNGCELTTTTATGKGVYPNAWATSHPITDDTVTVLVAAGRSRWKIENENHNVLNTKGYHFEHNYGHGQHPLAALLATLILLAYLCHTVLDWMDQRYRAVRAILPSRRTFVEHLRALLQYLHFHSWDQLMVFMLHALEPVSVKSG
ncbi:MAG: ISNCY family transposase [Candidatus Competibacteraceae bacterium]